MDYDPSNPLPSSECEAIEQRFGVETESLPAVGYFHSDKARFRKIAVRLISQYSISDRFDAFIPYLALNYFDRVFSKHRLPLVTREAEVYVKRLAIACLSIAWKMRNRAFSFKQFLKDRKLAINSRDVITMEFVILIGIRWRTRAVTALCFVGYFFSKLTMNSGTHASFKRQTINEIIIQAQGDINFTRFRPSVVAASALLAATSFLYPTQFDIFKRAILATGHINEDYLNECVEETKAMCRSNNIVMESGKLERMEGERLRVLATNREVTQPINIPPPSSPRGPNPLLVIPETPKERSATPEDYLVPEISEIEEVPESKQGPQMNFSLKWLSREERETTISPSNFPPLCFTETENHGGSANHHPLCRCCNFL